MADGEGGGGGDGDDEGADAMEFHKFFPSFIWVLRDFALDLVDEEGLAHALAPQVHTRALTRARAQPRTRAQVHTRARARTHTRTYARTQHRWARLKRRRSTQ